MLDKNKLAFGGVFFIPNKNRRFAKIMQEFADKWRIMIEYSVFRKL